MVREYFGSANVAMFTATPFRGDRQELDGVVVYSDFSMRDGILGRNTKNVVFEEVGHADY